MAVHLWRDRGMPFITIPGHARDAVRFVPEDVKGWVKKQGITKRTGGNKKQAFRFRPGLEATAA
jgi:hypothetical protein